MSERAVGAVGASARAAAMSLVRAGFEPWAVDLFADRDLQRVAPCVRCPLADYPAALPDLADQFPPGPVLYTGGLENHPDVVAELARRRPLWGVGPDVLARARDPFFIGRTLAAAELHYPTVLRPRAPLPPGRRWLSKPIRSAGGLGIRFADPADPPDPDRFVQEYIIGPPLSTLFCTGTDSTCSLGVTAQLVGEPWLHAGPFLYCGNVGPMAASDELRAALARMGDLIGRHLRGLWGVDFVLRDGHAVPIEINPRYTAAMEVLELASGTPVFADPNRPPRLAVAAPRPRPPVVGKAVYYAPRPLTFPASGPWDADLSGPFDPWRVPGFADIPAAGEPIEPGQPVLTFFATGSTADDCRAKLKVRAAELDDLFAPGQHP